MRAARLWLLLPLFLALSGSPRWNGQARTAAPIPRTAEKTVSQVVFFEARMDDESMVRVSLLQDQIQVNTPYGRLTVPARDVRKIEFGHHPPAGTDRRIRDAVNQLASTTFAAREAASKQLLSLGPMSYDALQQAARSGDLEAIRRAKALLKKLVALYPEERLQRKWYDLVYTPTFTIAGRVEGEGLKVKTAYFGESKLRFADLWTFRALDADSGVTVAVDAARYAGQAVAWLETNVEVRKGAPLHITATGQIDLYPLGNDVGKYMGGPAGSQWGGGGGFMAVRSPGTLIGRIGSNGKEFVVGVKVEEKARDSGRLFLRIIPSPWGNESTGEYKATIAVK